MLTVVLVFLVSGVVIVVAGTTLSNCADTIAEVTGFGRLLIGSVLLAGATSLPELAVDIQAVQLGLADVAVGDLMGSSMFNLLILGVLDMSHRSRGRMLSRHSAAHALSAMGSLVLTALAAFGILLGDRLAPYAIGGVGLVSISILFTYVLCIRLIYFDRTFHAQSEPEEEEAGGPLSLRRAIAGFVVASAAIFIAAPFLAEAAGEFATLTGVGETFVGTTLVALCTSLPELVASLAAIRISAFDLAIGNVFGSNALNMALILPLDLAHRGPLFAEVSEVHVVTGLATILITSVAVMGQLYHVETRKPLVEPDAIAVIALVAVALFLIFELSRAESQSLPADETRTEAARVETHHGPSWPSPFSASIS